MKIKKCIAIVITLCMFCNLFNSEIVKAAGHVHTDDCYAGHRHTASCIYDKGYSGYNMVETPASYGGFSRKYTCSVCGSWLASYSKYATTTAMGQILTWNYAVQIMKSNTNLQVEYSWKDDVQSPGAYANYRYELNPATGTYYRVSN